MTDDMHKDSSSFTIELAQAVRHRALLIVLCCGLAGIAAFAFSEHQPKRYTATASVLFRDAQFDQQAAGLQATPPANPQGQTDTNLALLTLPRIALRTAAAVGHGLTASTVTHSVSINELTDTSLAQVSATASSPALAARIANTYVAQAVANRHRANEEYFASALGAVRSQLGALSPSQQQSAQGAALRDRATSLQILSSLQGSDVQLAQPATRPKSPSSPKVLRNTVIGAFLGFVLGLALAIGLERFDQRLRDPSDLEEIYQVPLLAVVPESSALKSEGRSSDHDVSLPPHEAEIFSMLRAHIRYYNVDHQIRLVTVVSAAPGDGKTTIARNLSLAAAAVGARVLFMETDLRRPAAATHFGLHGSSTGIADVLIGGMQLEDAVERLEFVVNDSSALSVDVLLAGDVLPPNPTEALESHSMQALLDEARSLYDLVIIDTAPLDVVSDAFPLLRAADGVLIVSRLGRNRRDVAARLRRTLTSAEAAVIGVVANGYQHRDRPKAGYGYYRDYDSGRSLRRRREDDVPTNGVAPMPSAPRRRR